MFRSAIRKFISGYDTNSRTEKAGLKRKILLPLVLVFATLIGLFHYSMFKHANESLAREFKAQLQTANSYYQADLLQRGKKLGVGLDAILRDDVMRTALRAGNRGALLNRYQPLFDQLREQYGITHLYFEKANRVNLLRVHQPERYGDTVDRFTTLEAERAGRIARGIELGINGTFTLRAVAPIFDKAGLTGYVELGEEVEDILHSTDNVIGTSIVLAIGKKWLTREDWERGMRLLKRDANWDLLPDDVLIRQTIALPAKTLAEILQTQPGEIVTGLKAGEKIYYAGLLPLEDAAGRNVGSRIVLRDMTQQLHGMQQTMMQVAFISILLLVMLFVMFNLITGRVERRLEMSRKKLVAQGDELKRLNETLEQRVREEVNKNREKDALLVQQSRMAAMGEMIQNIAHQWRQPLNLVGLVAQNIREDFNDRALTAAALEKDVTTINQAVQQMSSTIDVFRNFLRPDQQQATRFSLAQAVGDVLRLLDASFKYHQINVVAEINEDFSGMGFSHQLCQVLINILNNAKEAIVERKIRNGTISISLGGDKETSWVVMRDNAGGIPEDVLSKIFDPYFSTKAQSTGLGLYMSSMIMTHMGGTIEAGNAGEGAEFKVTMPAR